MSTVDVMNRGRQTSQLPRHRAPTSMMAMPKSLTIFEVKSIFINIFGGITRGEEVARSSKHSTESDRRPNHYSPRQDQRRRRTRNTNRYSTTKYGGTSHAAAAAVQNKGKRMSIFVDGNTKVIYQGLTGAGAASGPARLRTQVVGGTLEAGRR